MFSGAKKIFKIFLKYCSVCTKKLHNIFFIKEMFYFFLDFFLPKNRLNIHNQLCIYCSTSTRDTSLRDFYIMTLVPDAA
jgi:hypothetical protein